MYSFPPRVPLRRRLHKYFNSSIREDVLLEAELLVLSFATGLNDASTYSEYRVFTANHTGNTILLAVGVAGETRNITYVPSSLALIGMSLSMFLLGAFIPGQIGNLVGCRRRWWLILTNFIQTLCVFGASAVGARDDGWFSGPRDNALGTDGAWALLVVALLAFSAGSQVCMARSLLITEIATANATSTYVDVLIDQDLFRAQNRRRNRRLFFLAIFSLGTFAGGFAYQKYGASRTIFISAVGKSLVTLALFMNGGISDGDDESKSDSKACAENKGSLHVNSWDIGIISEKPLYYNYNFDYSDSYPKIPEPVLVSRDDIPRYLLHDCLDFNHRNLTQHVPTWIWDAGTYIKRHLPGLALANTYPNGHLPGF